jgi:hypothetical protein
MCLCIITLGELQVGALAQTSAEPAVILYRAEQPVYSRRNFYLGAEAVGSLILNESGPHSFYSHGGGFSAFLGGRVHRNVALEFGWTQTFHGLPGTDFGETVSNGIVLSAITTDVKLFPLYGRVQPFFVIGPAAFIEHDWAFHYFGSGPGFSAGGGIDFYPFKGLALGLKAEYRGAQLYNYDAFRDQTWLSMLDFAGSLTSHF